MGIYSDYLNSNFTFEQLSQERKKQLAQISALRNGRDIIAYASDFQKLNVPVAIDNSDILPFQDQLSNLKGNSLDVILETPGGMAEVKAEYIASIKKMINDSENGLKTANSTMKPVYEKMLAEGKKQLKDAESPNNAYISTYEKNYPQMVKNLDDRHESMLKEWESIYPADPNQFIKRRLEEFLKVTSDIDFNAELVTKNGQKIFVNPDYENRDSRWKMAFRAGKEVVEPARAFVQQWAQEIK